MPAVVWKLNGTPFADLGLSLPVRTCRSGLEDTVTIQHIGNPVDAEPLLAWGDLVTIHRDATLWFTGRCNTVPIVGSPDSEDHAYTLVGPWWWLEQTIYTQPWRVWDPDSASLVTKAKSRCILNQAYTGLRIHSGDQIRAALQCAIDLGAPIAIGTVAPIVNIPLEEVLDISCAEVIRKMTRWSPDFPMWFDYSTSPPTFHCKSAASLPVLTYNLGAAADGAGGDPDRESVQVVARDDLKFPGIVIQYERTSVYDGVEYESIEEDTAGVTTDPRTVRATIELAGSNHQRQTQKIICEPWPDPLTDATWIKDHVPMLKEVDPADITILDAKIQETGDGLPDSDYPRVLIQGEIPTWAADDLGDPLVSTDYTVVCTFDYIVRNGVGGIAKVIKTQPFSFTVTATNAETGTYGNIDASTVEEKPRDVAQRLYESWGILHHEGVYTRVAEDVPAGTFMGFKLCLLNGQPVWGNMNAVIYQVVQDVENGRTTLSFGPNKYLGLQDLLAMLRGFRGRSVALRHKVRTSGKAADRGGGVACGGPAAKNDGVGAPGEDYKTFFVDGESSAERKISCDPTEIPSGTGAAINVKPRIVGLWDPATGKMRRAVVMCSDFYGADLVTPTDVTVVTDEQYDDPNLQNKTRSIRVLSAGSESAWTDIVEFEECPV
jgi:hypothetical protein